jgi:hypothetical protein
MLVALVKFLLIVVLTLCRENNTLEKHTNIYIYVFIFRERDKSIPNIHIFFVSDIV